MPKATSATIAVMVTIGRWMAKSEMNIYRPASSSSTRTRLPGVTPWAEPSSSVSPSATPASTSTSSAASSRTPSWTGLSADPAGLHEVHRRRVAPAVDRVERHRDRALGVGGDPPFGEESRDQRWSWLGIAT